MGDPPDAEAAARAGRHILPRDASAIVTVANGLSRHVTRPIDAIHAATVARKRAAIVSEFLPDFGISTECGLGRHSQAQLDAVVSAYRELAESRELATA